MWLFKKMFIFVPDRNEKCEIFVADLKVKGYWRNS